MSSALVNILCAELKSASLTLAWATRTVAFSFHISSFASSAAEMAFSPNDSDSEKLSISR